MMGFHASMGKGSATNKLHSASRANRVREPGLFWVSESLYLTTSAESASFNILVRLPLDTYCTGSHILIQLYQLYRTIQGYSRTVPINPPTPDSDTSHNENKFRRY